MLLPFVWVHVFGFVVRRRLRFVPTLFSLWLNKNELFLYAVSLYSIFITHTTQCLTCLCLCPVRIRTAYIYTGTRKSQAPQPRNTLIPIARSLAYSFVSSCTLFTIFPRSIDYSAHAIAGCRCSRVY